ncbi:MAG: hypothetical protein FJ216_02685 [Ignavibacteria bacterium]|nr:hypothetical protein [Ignavibacteria bacterium]
MENQRIYKYKLDIYYIWLVTSLLFLFVYILIRGRFFSEKFEVVFHDALIYVTLAVILYYLFLLAVNFIRARRIIFESDRIIFKNRFRERQVNFSDIIMIRYSREKKQRNEYKSHIRIVKLKLSTKKRFLRIKVSDFDNENNLLNEFKKINIQNRI